jgi:hypothetical protein
MGKSPGLYQLSDAQALVLASIYDVVQRHGKWPTYGYLERFLDREYDLNIEDISATMPPRLTTLPPGRYPVGEAWEVKLTVEGLQYVRTPAAVEDLDRFLLVFRRMVKQEKDIPVSVESQPKPCLTTDGLSEETSIHPTGLKRVFHIIAAEPEPWMGSFAAIGEGGNNLQICASKVLRQFRKATTLDEYFSARKAFFAPTQRPSLAPTPYYPTTGPAADPVAYSEKWGVFICHASPDKEPFVRGLADALRRAGVKVWYDDFTLTVGDSLRQKIDEGLAQSRYGVVVLSPSFFDRPWPQSELDGLAGRQNAEGRKVILPVLHNITIEEVRKRSPLLAGLLATASDQGISHVVDDLLKAMNFRRSL